MQKKSCCIRIGPRSDFKCANITTKFGCQIPWVSEIHYLGTYIVAGFRCSITYAKRSFHRSLNAIFGKVGRLYWRSNSWASIRSKCLSTLLYGLECYSLLKADLRSLDFVITRFLMKLFGSSNIDIINDCRLYFFCYPYWEKKREVLV